MPLDAPVTTAKGFVVFSLISPPVGYSFSHSLTCIVWYFRPHGETRVSQILPRVGSRRAECAFRSVRGTRFEGSAGRLPESEKTEQNDDLQNLRADDLQQIIQRPRRTGGGAAANHAAGDIRSSSRSIPRRVKTARASRHIAAPLSASPRSSSWRAHSRSVRARSA